MSSLADKEMEEQITAVGNTLLQLPSLHDELLPLLDQIEDLLKKVEQSPSRSMQTALSPLMQALVVEELLKHSDVDVKVAVASCISEIIRISAPDAPYDDDKLKDVFQLIVSSFENLSDTSSGSYDKRSTMLKTMAGCRSCVIMLDLECDQMIIEMFHNFLKAIRVNHAEAVFDSMEAIMILVLEESQDICPDLLIPILDTLKMNNQDVMPIAKKLAERVIQNSADMIRPYLAQSVKKLNADSDDFGKVVALVCRENTDIVGNSNESISRDQPASDTIEYGENLVGSKVKVWWAKDRMYYEGEIVSFDSAKKKHKVYYTDGEKEVLNLKRERWEFVGDDSVSDEAADVEHSSNDTSSDVQRKKKKGNTKFQSSKSRKRQKKYGSPKSKLKDTATKSGGKSKDDGKPESEFKVNNTKPSRNSIYNASIKPRDQPLRLGGKSQGDSAKASSGIRSKDNPAKTPSHPAKQDSQRSTAESIGKIPQSGKPLTKTSLSSKVKESGNPPTKTSSSSKAYWRMFKVRSVYRNRQNHIIAIQSLWRQNLAKRELRRLKKEANEAGALRLAKGKLEKQLEDLTWKLHLEKKIRVSNEESKSVEISKLQKTVESLTLELEVAKLGSLNEFNKNRLPKRQVELSAKEKSALEREVASLNEFRNENALLKGNREVLLRCIKENLGFRDGKPVAACVIYKCLLHWHAFEFKRTGTFDLIIESINNVFKDGDEDATLPYWLSNTSALLCLLQRNLRSNGFLTAGSQCSVGSTGVNGKLVQGPKSSFKYRGGLEDGLSHMEAKSPAVLFKQQSAACVEKIFGYIRDNLKKEISPLLGQCIQVPEKNRVHGGNSSRSPSGVPQQSPSSGWDSIIKFLDLLMSRLRGNYVPSFFIRKLTAEVFSFINIQLFNSLLLRRECCTFSNGEYIKSGLAELEKWIVNATEEFAGTSWHELNYIRQAVGFLVLHQKRKKSLDEIRQDLCPKLSVRQIYRISTMYWDDKNGTQSVSIEVLSQMRDIVNKGSQNIGSSNSLLLDDDLSIPLFSMEDVYMSIPAMDPSDIELPQFFFE